MLDAGIRGSTTLGWSASLLSGFEIQVVEVSKCSKNGDKSGEKFKSIKSSPLYVYILSATSP